MFRRSFEVSFITEFHFKGCQNSQKAKLSVLNIKLEFDFFHCFKRNIAAIEHLSSKISFNSNYSLIAYNPNNYGKTQFS